MVPQPRAVVVELVELVYSMNGIAVVNELKGLKVSRSPGYWPPLCSVVFEGITLTMDTVSVGPLTVKAHGLVLVAFDMPSTTSDASIT